MDFQKTISRIRETHGYSYAKIAGECDCTETHIRNLHNGKAGANKPVEPGWHLGQKLIELSE